MNSELVRERGTKAASKLMQMVQNSAMEAGLPRVLGFQVHRGVRAKSGNGIPTAPPLFDIMDLLSGEPLPRHTICSDCPDLTCPLAWVFAATTLQPGLLAELAGFSPNEIQSFLVYVCLEFYAITAKLLRKVKAENGSVSRYRAAVIGYLDTVYCLITYHGVHERLKSQFTTEADQVIIQGVKSLLVVQKLGEPLESEHSEGIFKRLAWQQLVGLRFLESFRDEGWDHLQAYVRHWLGNLGGCNRYSEVILKNLYMNTLCRITFEDKIEDHGQVPPDSDQHCDKIMLEACTTLQSLTKKEPDFGERFFRDLSSIAKKEIPRSKMPHCHMCDCRTINWISMVLDHTEELVMKTKAKKGSHGPNEYAMISPDLDVERLFGLKSMLRYDNRPMTEFHDSGKP